MRWVWLVTLVVVSGCATVGTGAVVRDELTFRSSAAAGRGWKVLETERFTLTTDLEPELAQQAARLLSQSLTGLNALFARAPVKQDVRIEVVAMADGLDFERRFGRRVGGFAASKPNHVTLVLYGPPDRWFERSELTYEGTESVVNHELAHAILRRYFPVQPRWFAEGMAEFLETFRWLDATHVRLGDPNLASYRAYRAIRSLSVGDLDRWEQMSTQRDLEVAGHYGLSWAFVHYLRNREPQSLGRYMSALAEQPAQAWARTFAGREDELDKAIFQYMKVGSYQQFTLEVPPAPAREASLRPATAAEQETLEKRLEELSVAMKGA
ncbi:MAG: DUF1570 domain-containing protein [Myxococcota bacterium]